MKILNFGSCNIDHVYSLDHIVEVGETETTDKLETFPGGKGLNQSIALARAGVDVYQITTSIHPKNKLKLYSKCTQKAKRNPENLVFSRLSGFFYCYGASIFSVKRHFASSSKPFIYWLLTANKIMILYSHKPHYYKVSSTFTNKKDLKSFRSQGHLSMLFFFAFRDICLCPVT